MCVFVFVRALVCNAVAELPGVSLQACEEIPALFYKYPVTKGERLRNKQGNGESEKRQDRSRHGGSKYYMCVAEKKQSS